jgi:hypothetical protein
MGAFLNAARQVQTIVAQKSTTSDSDSSADPLDMLEAAVALATHHDGMSGTEKQVVADDYELRLSEGYSPAAEAFSLGLASLGSAEAMRQCNGLNISFCPELASERAQAGTVNMLVYNQRAVPHSELVHVPLNLGDKDQVTVAIASTDTAAVVLPSQLLPVDVRSRSLSLMYLRDISKLEPSKIKEATNYATHTIVFMAQVPAVGFTSYAITITKKTAAPSSSSSSSSNAAAADTKEAIELVRRFIDEETVGEQLATAYADDIAKTDPTWPEYEETPVMATADTTISAASVADTVIAGGAGGAGVAGDADLIEVTNGVITLSYDNSTGLLSRVTHNDQKLTLDLSVDVGYYYSAGPATCTKGVSPGVKECNPQPSGAYIFRPASNSVLPASAYNLDDPAGPSPYGSDVPAEAASLPDPAVPLRVPLEIIRGAVVIEVRQQFAPWASLVTRLLPGSAFVDVQWTVGPIPLLRPGEHNTSYTSYSSYSSLDSTKVGALPIPKGKEVIIRYTSSLHGASTKERGGNAIFSTDANGRETVRRVVNERPSGYNEGQAYNISEPVAGNYYPVNTFIAAEQPANSPLGQPAAQLAVLVDRSQGGASLKPGQLELMVHRRTVLDDARGVGQPLSETMCGCLLCGCSGLTVRGRHRLLFGSPQIVNKTRRVLSDELTFPLTPSFSSNFDSLSSSAGTVSSFSALGDNFTLPANVQLLTLKTLQAEDAAPTGIKGAVLLRLAHLYEKGEGTEVEAPATVELVSVQCVRSSVSE